MLNAVNCGFTWIGENVDCSSNAALENGMSTPYKSFNYNGVIYHVQDCVLFKTKDGTSVARLLHVYESSAHWHSTAKYRGIVEWYTKAADLPKFFTVNKAYDKDHEVVEDLRRTDTYVSLEDILRKSHVFYVNIDSSAYLINAMKLNTDDNFFCRYKIMKNKLIPLAKHLSSKELYELNNTEFTPKGNKIKTKTNDENRYSDIKLGGRNGINPIQISPFKLHASILTPNRAKRNLNESFDSTPNSQTDTPILNYSIVENVLDSDKPIRIKLKLSNVQKSVPTIVLDKMDGNLLNNLLNDDNEEMNRSDTPIRIKPKLADSQILVPTVLLDKLDDDVVNNLLNNDNEEMEVAVLLNGSEDKSVNESATHKNNPELVIERPRRKVSQKIELRRSSRAISRKSYVDFVSPVKTTPTKQKVKNFDSDLITTDTPRKTRKEVIINVEKVSSKRTRTGSVTIDANMETELLSTPAKKLLESPGGRSKRTPAKPKKYTYDDEILDIILTPPKCKQTPRKPKKTKEKSPLKMEIDTLSAKHDIIRNQNNLTPDKNKKKHDDNDVNTVGPLKITLSTRRSRKMSEDSESSLPSPRKRANRTPSKLKDIYTTPKKNVRDVVPKTPKNTPSAKMRLIREGVITPSMQFRKTAVVSEGTPLKKAREKLHVSYVPDALPCREKEFADISSFVQGKLFDGCGGCMYVSGVPGTGKTATVTEVIRNLQEMVKCNDLPDFTFVSINGMKLTEPRQSYVEILKQLTGKTVAWEQAQSMLDTRFTKSSKRQNPAIVMLVDELDILCTKRQDVVYNLLDWPTKATAQLIVITIANTMDLPERLLMGRVTSRLGLTRLTFQAYTHKQLQEIVMKRLLGTNAFNPDAIQLVARKVASVSGDARRALDICRRSAEIAESEGPTTLVSMGHVNEALNAMITQPKVRAIKRCSRLEQLILQSVVAEVERTGVDETTFADIYAMLCAVAGIDGFQMVSITLTLAAISKLGSCRLLLTDQKSNDIHQRLILNVSVDDIYYALRKD